MRSKIKYIITRLIFIALSSVTFFIHFSDKVFAQIQEEQLDINDCGIYGHLFKIKEPSLLDEIYERLHNLQKDGKIEGLQQEFANRAKKKMLKPNSVEGIIKAQKNKSWLYDPSFIQKEAIRDIEDNIIVKANTKVNPLETISFGEPLIFIDGEDEKQINWVMNKTGRKNTNGKIVLTNGSPIRLGNRYRIAIYFDQGGILCRKFNIKAVPAIIMQEGNKLRIKEVKI